MDDDWEAELEELRREFVTTQLATRIAQLDDLVLRVGSSDETREAARRAAHMLRGTSGSYGMRALSTALAPLEELLKKPLEDPAAPARARELFVTANALAREILRAHGISLERGDGGLPHR
jgi:chemotaxis protein histidine kinase CheA